MQIEHHASTDRAGRRPTRLAEILAEPRLRHCTSPTTCSRSSGRPTQGWHDARITPYGPLTLDPATAVLHYAQEIFEGMKAYRHEDGSVWTFRPEENAERMVRSAPPARAARAAGRGLRRRPSTRWSQVDQRWVPERGGGEEPLRAAVHVRLRGVPRRAALPARHVHGDRLARPAPTSQGRRQAGHALADRGLHPRRPRRHGRGQDRRQLRQLAGRPAGGHRRRAATRSSSSTPPRASTSRSSAG